MKVAEHKIPEGNSPEGRATTPEQKQEITRRILAAWERVPSLRFGQFIWGALHLYAGGTEFFFIEDENAALACERFAEVNNPAPIPFVDLDCDL